MSTLPIAEIFTSIQGEGYWVGTPMTFVRLAGCTVGKYNSWPVDQDDKPTVPMKLAEFPLVKEMKHSICTTIDGQHFVCDTDYHATRKMAIPEILAEIKVPHVCITGGEPFMHDFEDLVEAIEANEGHVHIETSGTIEYPEWLDQYWCWVTCCPKQNVVINTAKVNEFKILVGPNFDEKLLTKFDGISTKYLQPINGVHDVWKENLAKCIDLVIKNPDWKLSAQLHKFLEVR